MNQISSHRRTFVFHPRTKFFNNIKNYSLLYTGGPLSGFFFSAWDILPGKNPFCGDRVSCIYISSIALSNHVYQRVIDFLYHWGNRRPGEMSVNDGLAGIRELDN